MTVRPADRPVEDGLFWYGLDPEARQFQRQVLRQISGEPVVLPVVRRRS